MSAMGVSIRESKLRKFMVDATERACELCEWPYDR
jgi:hypothetical protein